MPRYRVSIDEITRVSREAYFGAPDADTARTLAESEDWRDWDETSHSTETAIDYIEEVSPDA